MARQHMVEPGRLSWPARVIFTAVALTAFGLGVIGFRQYLPAHPEYGLEPLDVVYYSLQLFVLDAAPLQTATNLPIALQIARFAAPAVTAYLIFLAAQELFAERLVQARIRLMRGHSVLCGPPATVAQLAEQIRREAGGDVVTISGGPRRVQRRGPPHVVGDPRQQRTLERAGLDRASELITVGPDSPFNAEVAIAVHAFNRTKRTAVTCYAEARENELFQAVVAQAVGPAEVNRLDSFNRHDRTARALLEHFPPQPPTDPAAAVLVVGYHGLGRDLVDRLVQFWSGGGTEPGESVPRLGILDADAPVEAIDRRYAQYRGRVTVSARACNPANLSGADELLVLAADGTPSVPSRVYVCLDDDGTGIAIGDTALRLLADHPAEVVVAVPNSGVLGEAAGITQPGHPAPSAVRTAGRARLHLVSVVRTVYAIAAMRTGMNEQLARAIHETYCAHASRQGDTPATNESLREWDELPRYLQDSNREQAWDIGRKLALIGLSAVPGGSSNAPATLPESDVETLARVEHRRWMQERTALGWRHGPVHDHVHGLHPDLVDWEYLSDDSRDKDRSAVREIPRHLAKAGLQIIRTG